MTTEPTDEQINSAILLRFRRGTTRVDVLLERLRSPIGWTAAHHGDGKFYRAEDRAPFEAADELTRLRAHAEAMAGALEFTKAHGYISFGEEQALAAYRNDYPGSEG